MLMSEIEKMYENAGIEKELAYFECNRGRSSMRCCPVSSDERDKECSSCFFRDKMKEVYEYPPFTAEKQLELIKWLAKIGIKIDNKDGEFTFSIFGIISDFSSFEKSLANLINNIWKDLTEEEKQQVKGILE